MGIIPVHFLHSPETVVSMLPAAACWIATMLKIRGMVNDLVLWTFLVSRKPFAQRRGRRQVERQWN
jgi:hypothetical protein